jgi:hypothetical protein
MAEFCDDYLHATNYRGRDSRSQGGQDESRLSAPDDWTG